MWHNINSKKPKQRGNLLGLSDIFIVLFNLGRYWEIGPQKRLYVPAPLLKQGKNEIIVFETEGKSTGTIEFKDEPDIG